MATPNKVPVTKLWRELPGIFTDGVSYRLSIGDLLRIYDGDYRWCIHCGVLVGFHAYFLLTNHPSIIRYCLNTHGLLTDNLSVIIYVFLTNFWRIIRWWRNPISFLNPCPLGSHNLISWKGRNREELAEMRKPTRSPL